MEVKRVNAYSYIGKTGNIQARAKTVFLAQPAHYACFFCRDLFIMDEFDRSAIGEGRYSFERTCRGQTG